MSLPAQADRDADAYASMAALEARVQRLSAELEEAAMQVTRNTSTPARIAGGMPQQLQRRPRHLRHRLLLPLPHA